MCVVKQTGVLQKQDAYIKMKDILEKYQSELGQELENILSYWSRFTPDERYGGFTGRIHSDNRIDPKAPKGSVLNSRILWAFSAAAQLTGKNKYLDMAKRAYHFFISHFLDTEFGGVFWTLDYLGAPLDTKKQVYALSFAVYGLSEYYKVSGDEEARTKAIDLYRLMIEHSYDKCNGGYIEALSREWKEMEDIRLSPKDANERKSMNTHLHVLEAFSNLYRIWPDEILNERIKELVDIFLEHIISGEDHHLRLFFDDKWQPRSSLISYGHDIEAAWLLLEAAELLGGKPLMARATEIAISLAEAVTRGLDSDGGLWYEKDPVQDHLVLEKHSWPQAEAMVGFFVAWQVSGREIFLRQSLQSWGFVKKFMIDPTGEWFWGVFADYAPMKREDKVGIWKCPYHNTRACMEIIKRVKAMGDHGKAGPNAEARKP